jgi:hypothetical protein
MGPLMTPASKLSVARGCVAFCRRPAFSSFARASYVAAGLDIIYSPAEGDICGAIGDLEDHQWFARNRVQGDKVKGS